jgi:hypothetical protein
MEEEEAKRHAIAEWLRNLAVRVENGKIRDLHLNDETPVLSYHHPADMYMHGGHSGERIITLKFVDEEVEERTQREIAEHMAGRDYGGVLSPVIMRR